MYYLPWYGLYSSRKGSILSFHAFACSGFADKAKLSWCAEPGSSAILKSVALKRVSNPSKGYSMLWVTKYDIRLAFHEIFNSNPEAIILKNTDVEHCYLVRLSNPHLGHLLYF